MACFLAPMALAIVMTIVQVLTRHSELSHKLKLSALNAMLWGGVVILAAEHVFHGEITAWAPYLTAMSSQADTAVMLSEIASIGGSMTLAISGTWVAMLAVNSLMMKRIAIKDQMSPLSRPISTTK
ncbi:MAG: hypothetical protein NWE92_08810 [Candidatus Bathyarchaeota archaeon]|nr:hypothetical protein [Candidatus Bathyarchaeota archaeon]